MLIHRSAAIPYIGEDWQGTANIDMTGKLDKLCVLCTSISGYACSLIRMHSGHPSLVFSMTLIVMLRQPFCISQKLFSSVLATQLWIV